MPKRKRKRVNTLESFSMVTRCKIDDVSVRPDDWRIVPAVCVKVPPLQPALLDELRTIDQETINRAFEKIQLEWWHYTPQSLVIEHLRPAFRDDEPDARAAGRSDGWVIVRGIGTPDDWSERQLRAWRAFEAAILASLSDAEKAFRETLKRKRKPSKRKIS